MEKLAVAVSDQVTQDQVPAEDLNVGNHFPYLCDQIPCHWTVEADRRRLGKFRPRFSTPDQNQDRAPAVELFGWNLRHHQ